MNKIILYSLISIFSGIGSWLPTLWHASLFSISSILGGIVGLALGIYVYTLLNDYIDG